MKLNIFIMTFSLAIISQHTNAETIQPNLVSNIRGGLTYSRISQQAFDNTYGYGAGANAKYFFTDLFGVGTGLEFESRSLGTKSSIVNIADKATQWLDIPLTASFRLGSKHQTLFDIGVFYSVALQSKTAEKGNYGDSIQTNNGFGPLLRAGYMYQTDNHFGAGVDLTMKLLPDTSFKLFDSSSNRASGNNQHFIGIGMNVILSFGAFI